MHSYSNSEHQLPGQTFFNKPLDKLSGFMQRNTLSLRMLSCETFIKTKIPLCRATPQGCHGTERENPVSGLWKICTFKRTKPIQSIAQSLSPAKLNFLTFSITTVPMKMRLLKEVSSRPTIQYAHERPTCDQHPWDILVPGNCFLYDKCHKFYV